MNTLSSKLLDFTDKPIFIGLDVHKKSWAVTLYSDEFELKTFTQPPNPDVLVKYLNQHYPGAKFKAVYEAGFSGFWAQRELSRLGICCHIIHPADVPTSDKEKRQKTDKMDSRKLSRVCKGGDFKAIYIAVYEAGFSGFWAQRELSRLGICCHIIHPADVPSLLNS